MKSWSAALPSDALTYGASLYWLSALLVNTNMGAVYTAEIADALSLSAGLVSLFSVLIELSAMLVLALCAARMSAPGVQSLLAATVVVVGVACLVLTVAGGALAGLPLLAFVLQNVQIGAGILCWALLFTVLERHAAERTAFRSLVLALALYLVLVALVPSAVVLVCVADAALALSVVPCLFGRYDAKASSREDAVADKSVLAPLYGTRAFLGACTGAISFLCSLLATESARRAPFVAALAFVVVAVYSMARLRTDETDVAALRLLPFAAFGFIVSPYLDPGNIAGSLCQCASAFVLVGWAVLHSVQLSEMKGRAGLGDVALSFSETIALMLAMALVQGVLLAVPGLDEALAGQPELVVVLLFCFVFVDLFVCSYQLSLVIDAKESERIVERAFELSDQRNEPLLDHVGKKYGLTVRELDVLRLLVKGVTRAAICEELCISANTVRTHAWHIYQKLGVHTRDELMELMDDEAHEYLAKQEP